MRHPRPRRFPRVRHVYLELPEDIREFIHQERQVEGLTARAWVISQIRAVMLRKRMGI
jgi:hypothetical protein